VQEAVFFDVDLLCYPYIPLRQGIAMATFAGQLEIHFKQARLSLRQISSRSGIPHQTLYNWLKGTRPRWHPALSGDLLRLGTTLGLAGMEIDHLLALAGCISSRIAFETGEENQMSRLSYRIPKGWDVSSDGPIHYDMGLDPSVTHQDHSCITIKAGPEPTEFGSLLQTFKAGEYRGKRLRYTAAVRAQDIVNRAALFMRVDGPSNELLAFDNMRERPITGTQDWTDYSIVLDVAENAENIVFGILLSFLGQVWMSNVRLDVVGLDVPTTDILENLIPPAPVNLGFDEEG
jgi:hypothetical protein